MEGKTKNMLVHCSNARKVHPNRRRRLSKDEPAESSHRGCSSMDILLNTLLFVIEVSKQLSSMDDRTKDVIAQLCIVRKSTVDQKGTYQKITHIKRVRMLAMNGSPHQSFSSSCHPEKQQMHIAMKDLDL
jgi:hypothetical protein